MAYSVTISETVNDVVVDSPGYPITINYNATVIESTGNVANLQAEIDAVEANVVILQGNVTTLTADVANNTANITTLQGNITGIESDVANNAANITTLQGNITTLTGDIANNTANIANNTANITTLQGNVTTLTADVANNTANIATNTSRIANIEANVTQATGVITTGNLSAGNAAVSGNITTGNILTDGYYYANGAPFTGAGGYGNSEVAAFLAAFGSNTISTTGDVSTGNVTAGNITTAGAVTATGNITGGNLRSQHFDAVNSAGGSVRNSSGTAQISWGAGGGNNVSFSVAVNINPANSQVEIAPTGTGHVDITPDGHVTIAPSTQGSINNMVIGNATPAAVTATTVTATGNITGDYILGNGSQLTGLPAGYTDSDVANLLAAFGSNTISTTGNIDMGNSAVSGNVSANNVSANRFLNVGTASDPGIVNVYDVGSVRLWDNNNTNYVGLSVAGDVGNSYTVSMPSEQGAANTVLVNDGSGALAWQAQYGDSDVATLLAAFGSNSISTTGNVDMGNSAVTGNVSANVFLGTSGNVRFDPLQALQGLSVYGACTAPTTTATRDPGVIMVGNTAQLPVSGALQSDYNNQLNLYVSVDKQVTPNVRQGGFNVQSTIDYGNGALTLASDTFRAIQMQNFVTGNGAVVSSSSFLPWPIAFNGLTTVGQKSNGFTNASAGNITVPGLLGMTSGLSVLQANPGVLSRANSLINMSSTVAAGVSGGASNPRGDVVIGNSVSYLASFAPRQTANATGTTTCGDYYGYAMFRSSSTVFPGGSGLDSLAVSGSPTYGNLWFVYNNDERFASYTAGTVTLGNSTANTQVQINQGDIEMTGNLEIGNAIAFSGNVAVTATDTTISHKIPVVINGVTYYIALTAAQ